MLSYEAGQVDQETEYFYGTDPSRGDGIASNDILAALRYPDKMTGQASSVEQDTFAVKALGQRIYLTDRNSNGHLYEYDVLGRMTGDIVSTLGTGVDGAIRRIGSTFNTQGLIETLAAGRPGRLIWPGVSAKVPAPHEMAGGLDLACER